MREVFWRDSHYSVQQLGCHTVYCRCRRLLRIKPKRIVILSLLERENNCRSPGGPYVRAFDNDPNAISALAAPHHKALPTISWKQISGESKRSWRREVNRKIRQVSNRTVEASSKMHKKRNDHSPDNISDSSTRSHQVRDEAGMFLGRRPALKIRRIA